MQHQTQKKSGPWTFESALKAARLQLDITHSPASDNHNASAETNHEIKREAETLLCHLLDCQRTLLYTWPERELSAQHAEQFFALIARRRQGEPIAYITEQREFWGLNLTVSPATLIPRADTETLVAAALEKIRLQPNPSLLDLGTGSGAIILALASERADAVCHAVDLSPAAIAIARHNAQKLNLSVQFFVGSWFEPINGQQYDLIISNPPYIEDQDPHLQRGDLPFEPATALSSGADGLDDLRLIIHQAWSHLNHQAWLMVEHGYNQAEAVAELFNQQGYQSVELRYDLSEQPRVTIGQKP